MEFQVQIINILKIKKDRCNIKLPLDILNEKVKILTDKLVELDTDVPIKHAPKLHGINHADYTYTPIVRVPEPSDDPAKKDIINPPYIKAFFNIEGSDDAPVIKTLVYRTCTKEEQESTGNKRVPVNVTTIEELAAIVTYQSTVTMILQFNKVWCAMAKDKKTKTIDYGIGLKILQVEVDPSVTGAKIASSFVDDAFLDEESDEGVKTEKKDTVVKEFDPQVGATKKSTDDATKKSTDKTPNKTPNADLEDDEDDEGEEVEEEDA